MNAQLNRLFSAATIDNVCGFVLVVAIIGACGAGFVEAVRMMAGVVA